MKLCKDCKYSKWFPQQGDAYYMACLFYAKKIINPVYGDETFDGESKCETERGSYNDTCSIVGKHYKRKWWKFWVEK